MNMNSFRQNQYFRADAVKYAIIYALKPNPAYRYFPLTNNNTSGDCANFVSQCLHAGGAPMNYSTRNPWWYRHSDININRDTWFISWAVANSLYWYLKINQASHLPGAKGLEVQNVSLLKPGDLIFFEDNKGFIFHSTIVTSLLHNKPLISHHSFEALNIPYQSSWPAYKMHFLKISI
ncbi:amidase domain-containing protein [Clostridium ljungdahlii]